MLLRCFASCVWRRLVVRRRLFTLMAWAGFVGFAPFAWAQDVPTVRPPLLPAAGFWPPTQALLDGCGVPLQAMVIVRRLSGVPGAVDAATSPSAPWCARADEHPVDLSHGNQEILELDGLDFVSDDQGGTISAVGAEGTLSVMSTAAASHAASESNGFHPFGWFQHRSTDGTPVSDPGLNGVPTATGDGETDPTALAAPASLGVIVTPDLVFFARPGGLFAFDRHQRRFCSIAAVQPSGLSERVIDRLSDGRLLVATWWLPSSSQPVQQSVLLLSPALMCPGGPSIVAPSSSAGS